MIVTGLHHYTLRAGAEIIDECVSFYTSVLNLRIGFRPPFEQRGFWLYTGDQALLQLEVCEHEELGRGAARDRLAFACVNLPVAIRRLEDLGIDYTTNHLVEIDQFQIFLKDPSGLRIELNFACEKL